MKKTIKDVEAQIAEKVCGPLRELHLLPEGYRCSVRLHGKSRDKRRTASFEKHWSPDTDSIYIRFRPTSKQPQAGSQPVTQGVPTALGAYVAQPDPIVTDRTSDLIRALDRAESRPGYEFVALKWFRDTVLPAEGFTWAGDLSARQATLREAIEKRLILTSKMPNPKSPQFPVTAIRLNRLMPEVRAVLGSRGEEGSDFQPVPIRGENLSMTVLRDRH